MEIPELTAEQESIVALFDGGAAAEKAEEQNEAELLAAIYAAPCRASCGSGSRACV